MRRAHLSVIQKLYRENHGVIFVSKVMRAITHLHAHRSLCARKLFRVMRADSTVAHTCLIFTHSRGRCGPLMIGHFPALVSTPKVSEVFALSEQSSTTSEHRGGREREQASVLKAAAQCCCVCGC